jgi:hypothetical protein
MAMMDIGVEWHLLFSRRQGGSRTAPTGGIPVGVMRLQANGSLADSLPDPIYGS